MATKHSRLEFGEALERIISDVVPTPDPLDLPEFDPTQYINTAFPTEQSLTNLDAAVGKVKIKIGRLDQEIRKAIREQVGAGSKGKQSLDQAKRDINDLFSRIKDIQSKAESSEKMVTELVKDIKNLDVAKKNLTTTVTSLKRLNMLLSALQQLEDQRTTKSWSECAKSMEAVTQLSEFFTPYKHITKVQEIFKRIDKVRQTLKDEIYDDFSSFLQETYAHDNTEDLSEACLVIEALEKDSRKAFMAWFSSKEFTEYNRVFHFGEEGSKLPHVERRFSWFRNLLARDEPKVLKIFPEQWNMGSFLAEDFCWTTRQMLSEILEANHQSLDAATIFSAMKTTIDFENELSERFKNSMVSVEDQIVEAPKPDEEVEEEKPEEPLGEVDNASLNPHSVEAIRKRYRDWKSEKAKEKPKNVRIRQVSKFIGIMSSVFEPYMDIYMQQEEENLHKLIEEKSVEETWSVDEEDLNKILLSSTDLIAYFQTRMSLVAGLTRKGPFLDLFKLFIKYLNKYTEVLMHRLPSPDAKISEREAKTICLIANTSEYLSKNSEGLARRFIKMIHPTLVDKVHSEEEKKAFEELTAKAINALSVGLENNLESALNFMTKMPWKSLEEVGDQSEYVNQICTTVQSFAPVYKHWLTNKRNFDFFCDSFSASFPDKLMQNVFKCKRISEVGVQQLMLDFNVIKTLLLDLPQENASARYMNRVKKKMNKIELLLKVIGSHENTIIETYQNLITEGRSEAELTKILDLRGFEKPSLLKEFAKKIQLEPSNSPITPVQKNYKTTFSEGIQKIVKETKNINFIKGKQNTLNENK